MKKLFFLFLIIISVAAVKAQTLYSLPYDTLKIKSWLKFGNLNDARLYRDAAWVIKTDSAFSAGKYYIGSTEIITKDRILKNVILDSSVILDSNIYYAVIHASDSALNAMNGRLSIAEANISEFAGDIADINGDILGVQAGLLLKANVTAVDSLGTRIGSAEAGIEANASSIKGLSASLLLYAKKDSIMSYVEITPEMITISGATTFAAGYDPTTKTTSSDVTTIIGNTVTTTFINAMTLIADSIAASKIITSPIISGGTITGTTIKTSDGAYNVVIGNDEIEMAQGSVHISATSQTLNLDATDVIVSNNLKAGNYFSGDNTQGATATVSGLVFKDGIYTGGSITGSAGGTVTSVAIAGGTGLTTTGGPITDYGTITVSAATGYAIPTTTEITNWNNSYSSVGVSGDNLVFGKVGGGSSSITVPYATNAGAVAWANVGSKPTTLSGYGITDGATQTWVQNLYSDTILGLLDDVLALQNTVSALQTTVNCLNAEIGAGCD